MVGELLRTSYIQFIWPYRFKFICDHNKWKRVYIHKRYQFIQLLSFAKHTLEIWLFSRNYTYSK